ncbi:MAG: VWA domain-containing protein [Dechloromonas sp.]|nr:VWA domain-containing protein [Dechloromonas sp.]
MTTLTQSNGYVWDLYDYNGSVSNGSVDAYDGGMVLTGYSPSALPSFEDTNRELVFGVVTSGQVSITRKVFVPDTGTGFARYLEIITNTGSTATTFNVGISSNLGSDSSTAVLATSSGDTVFSTTDRWIITDDSTTGLAGGDPVVAHVFGASGGLSPTSVTQSSDAISYNFNLSLAAGQTKIIMHFGVQADTLANAQSTVSYIQGQPNAIFSGMSSTELAQLVNYSSTVVNSTYAIAATTTSKAEGNSGNTAFSFTVTRTGDTTVAGTVGYSVSATGASPADASDFSGGVLPSGTLTFAAGQTSKVVTIQVSGDTTFESNQTFAISLQNATAGTILTTKQQVTATIINDDLSKLTVDDDVAQGSLGADYIAGLAGDDLINGLDGNDVLVGGSGDDSIVGGGGSDKLGGSSGDDTVIGGSGNDVLYAGAIPGWESGDEIQTASATGTIPSTGQSLAISLNAPVDSESGSVVVDGLVSRSVASSNQYNIVYVIDRSGSMSSSFSGTETVPDMNGDGYANQLMDAAIKSFESLNTSLINGGFASSRLGIVEFGNSSGGASSIYNGTLSADSNNNGVTNAAEALRTLTASSGTPYDLGLQQAISFFQGAPAGNNIVYFISDGAPDSTSSYQDEVATLLASSGINATIRAIGLGAGASLSALDLVDDGTANSSAVRVNSPSQLTSGLITSPVSSADIARVEILKGSVVVATIPSNQLVVTPLGLKYSATISGLNTTDGTTLTARVVATDAAATTLSTNVTIGNAQYNDYLYGGSGNDTLFGGKGEDFIDGGSGTDAVSYGQSGGAVTVSLAVTTAQNTGALGFDTLKSIENIFGSAFSDTLTGSSANNLIRGENGNDTIKGGTGNDRLEGGDGVDTLYGEVGVDILVGGLGNDTYVINLTASGALEDSVIETSTVSTEIDTIRLSGTSTNTTAATISLSSSSLVNVERLDALGSGASMLNLNGNTLANTLTGNSANNLIRGYSGNDSLLGAAGNDTLDGGVGKDTLSGGSGNDVFDFNSISEMGITSSTWDVISDFVRGQDKIDLSTIDANTATTSVNEAFSAIFIGSTASFTAAGQLKFTSGVLYGNTDADATAEFAIQLTGVTTLSASDLIL